jgi:hypothetical protein
MLHLLRYVPAVIGRYDARPGLSLSKTVDLILLGAFAWQAAVFARAIGKMENEDTE